METLKIDIKNALSFFKKNDFDHYSELTKNADIALKNKTGKGSEFLGWYDLPVKIANSEIAAINAHANDLRKKSDVIVVIGIGGSYLGAKALIEALSGQFDHLTNKPGNPLILFAGQNLSEDYMFELMDFLKDRKFSLIVISKSGTTTEPAVSFRILKNELESKVGKKEASERIIAITDASKGALRSMANQEAYKSFIIDDNIGGRFSVLSPVGLLPVACAGFDIEKIVNGAKDFMYHGNKTELADNHVYTYAAIRHALYKQNKTTEILANFDPRLNYIAEWWKQLYGESEGKENKGIFPASVSFTTDLHSMGQYIQEGLRNIFETVISVEKPKHNLTVPSDPDNFDKLNFLAGKHLDYINKMAELGTMLAHIDGGVPNIKITLPEINEYYLGQLIYFFEKACAISGYLLEINPFDQPGVEEYKRNMFALLDKPGFEEETRKIKERLK
ncbi:MAG: glucose-6-phosphate isomerase [Bacteroidetes bacterium GWC2_33_15]|nr:MAG: glucose-6-phosphate isomerase [Bacteroidetes bacterium GWA2_33_15]OFX51883.1 MAG: glucose-6-phosphate isomerase [Bacteroidetes bacterium GWC2_33_15]OFX63451.1 MAG: glucose-6-phosphate isomerase [Bacteroidetes bacterium GWB2_32_14]OFX67200.1 MAG: glucose-6-phosphate isomerase [Bacteroidetes bacterium GWD2_33_33]HAN17075.1 glucose-6-phosphate isomerase [Bacteroidales bacterium]